MEAKPMPTYQYQHSPTHHTIYLMNESSKGGTNVFPGLGSKFDLNGKRVPPS
jgi:hypothetical protein